MALSTGKRIASGICFGRKVSSTKPRVTSHGDRHFQNCNRLGCSIRHIFSKGTEVSPEESLHSSQTSPSSIGFQRSREQKRVTSSAHNSSGQTSGQRNTRKKLKKDSPITPIHSNREQDRLRSVVDALPSDASGSSGSPSGVRKRQIIRSIRCGNEGNYSSSSQKNDTSCGTSKANKPNIEKRGFRKLNCLSPSVLSSDSSPATLVKEKRVTSSRNRGPPYGVPSSRSKAVIGSSNSVNGASVKSRIISSSSTSRMHSLRRTSPVDKTSTANRSRTNRDNQWELEAREFSTYRGFQAGLQSWNEEEAFHMSTSYNATAPDTNMWGRGGGRLRSNDTGIPEAPCDPNGMQWETEPPLERMVVALEASMIDQQGFHDQHRDMRMDIDNMTYEELLALGEKIGTVSTALTDEALSKCIAKSIYQPWYEISETSNSKDDDVKCSICQEEYVGGDEVGKLLCNHRYHVDCIHQWFQLKNWCPICKSSASPPSVMEQRE